MASKQELIRAFVGGTPSKSLSEIRRSFKHTRSTLAEYAGLKSGHGYDFNARPTSVEAVSTTREPAIPFMITLEPPEKYPTGSTQTKQVPAPQVADTNLTGFNERYQAQQRRDKVIRQVVNVTPSTSLEIEVPVFENGELDQRRKGHDNYLKRIKERYQNFRKSSQEARARIRDQNQNIKVGSPERTDPDRNNHDMKRERTPETHLEYLKEQAEYLRELPPFFAYINPQSFSKSYEHIVSDGNRTRDGHTVEFWGEQQVQINASGKIGAFYVDNQNDRGQKTGGLAVNLRRGSYAYQNLMTLHQIYRNNGYIFNQDHRISLVGAVKIFYDGTVYTGSFDSFNITHSEESPFAIEYSFNFTVRFEQSIKNL